MCELFQSEQREVGTVHAFTGRSLTDGRGSNHGNGPLLGDEKSRDVWEDMRVFNQSNR